ncbi:MarR family transcriptional regulator (plasmid) [Frigoribacterium sp. NBH87]|uniref:MarR family winged helix-turn-helix transcriptional regulator n=1 Tax=Frigoribacterium sp. NBH87 TaxID=2596916 RepID=UPI001624C08A|nr:MarR family transcriptional regulator [Frigoribacterium sp. NBH87]QNE45384.1 MarR family transcriptional regulator [Frigoribacterium sp. NBH87]
MITASAASFDRAAPTWDDAFDAYQRLLGRNADATTVLEARHGVTPIHLRALIVLASRGPLSVSHLGVAVGLSSGAVTPLVDRLEQYGHAERKPMPADRRSVVVTALPAGLDIAAHLRDCFAAVFARASGDDLSRVVETLVALDNALETEVTTW